MSTAAQGAAVRSLGFRGPGAIVAFAIGVATVVIGALDLTDGVLDLLGRETVFFGNVSWEINLVLGLAVIVLGGIIIGLARRMDW